MFACRAFALSSLKKFPIYRPLYQTYRQVLPGISFKVSRWQSSSTSASLQEETKSLVNAVTDDNKSLSVHWQDSIARFHHVWLRHHCPCAECLNQKTKQRTVDMALISEQIKPQQVHHTSNKINIVWADGHETCYDGCWLKENAYDGVLGEKHRQEKSLGAIANESEMTLWNRDVIASHLPQEFNYLNIMEGDETALQQSLNGLFRYGFVFVNETPTDEESILKICQKIVGPIRETPEGRVYVIENKELMDSDLSHFSNALDGHTDFSFYKDPPGIQAMHCTHHYGSGGMSLLVDGFKIAKILHQQDPVAYKILTSTEVRFVSKYFCIQAHGPIFELDPFTKELTTVRYNNSRVDEFVNMKLSFDEMEKFYHAVRLFGSIARRPENELWFKLTPGKVVLMDNRRTLHGRSAVQGPRKLIGCYVSVDDYLGKWRSNRMNQNQRKVPQ